MTTPAHLRPQQAPGATWRWRLATALIALLTTALHFLPVPPGAMGQLEYTLKDSLWRHSAQATPETRIVIVDLD